MEKLCCDILHVVLCLGASPEEFLHAGYEGLVRADSVTSVTTHWLCYDVRCGALSDLCPVRIRLLFYVGSYTGTFNQVTGVCWALSQAWKHAGEEWVRRHILLSLLIFLSVFLSIYICLFLSFLVSQSFNVHAKQQSHALANNFFNQILYFSVVHMSN